MPLWLGNRVSLSCTRSRDGWRPRTGRKSPLCKRNRRRSFWSWFPVQRSSTHQPARWWKKKLKWDIPLLIVKSVNFTRRKRNNVFTETALRPWKRQSLGMFNNFYWTTGWTIKFKWFGGCFVRRPDLYLVHINKLSSALSISPYKGMLEI